MPSAISLDLWNQIRVSYIEGNETYSQLAQRFGISTSSVENRASREGWATFRKNYRSSQSSTTSHSPSHVVEPVISSSSNEFPQVLNKLTLSDISQLLHKVILRISDEINSEECPKLERLAVALTKVVESYLKVNPVTPYDWLGNGINHFNLSAAELGRAVREQMRRDEAK